MEPTALLVKRPSLKRKQRSVAKGQNTTRITVNPKMAAFLEGTLTLDDMDDEEIMRGQFRAEDGTFRGRPTDIVPRKFHDELVRQTIQRMNSKFREELEPSVQVLKSIANNPKASADARMKSAIYLIERILGKVPEKTIVEAKISKWEDNIDDLLVE